MKDELYGSMDRLIRSTSSLRRAFGLTPFVPEGKATFDALVPERYKRTAADTTEARKSLKPLKPLKTDDKGSLARSGSLASKD